MSQRFRIGLLLAAFMLAPPALAQGVDDGQGREWRPLPQSFLGLLVGWEQVAAVCPTDGVTPCFAALGTLPMKKWVWATAPQVLDLFGSYVPAILGSPSHSVAGFDLVEPATRFQALLGVTASFSGCPTYQPCFNSRFSTGMTASLATPGLPAVPYAGEVALDLANGSAGFRIFAPLHPSTAKGLFMWRPTGRGTAAVHANDDAGSPAAPGAGAAVANVLANDWVGGQRATLGNVLLSQISSPVAGIWLDTSDGAVRVGAGTAAGSYTLSYRICNAAAPEFCDNADVTVTVRSFALVARPDVASVSMHRGGLAIANVLANDSLGTAVPSTATVRLSLVSSSHPGLSLDEGSGAVSVAPATPSGTHVLSYRICEIANPANCAQTTATVKPYTIDAVNDSARASSKTGGVAIASVLANDIFNGARATPATVQLSLPAALPKGISLNLGTGAVTVAPKTNSGTYTFSYTICEINSPANCDTAVVTLDLSGRGS